MRTLLTMLVALGALAVAGPVEAATHDVNIHGNGFSPSTVTITAGDTVTWHNHDNATHQVLSDDNRFVSPLLHEHASWSFTFKAAGTYHYRDELHPHLHGTVVVKGAPPSVALAATQTIVTYDTQVTLSGTVSDHRSGESVVIYYQPYGTPSPIERATVLSGAGGAFSFLVEPQIQTTYEAAWKGAFSAPTTIQVAPRLTIGRDNGWILHAAAGRSFAGRAVEFQRLNTATGQWVTLKKVVLSSRSGAKLILPLPHGVNHLRLAMSVNQAGAGYLGTASPELVWHAP
jgi:plastocyanin